MGEPRHRSDASDARRTRAPTAVATRVAHPPLPIAGWYDDPTDPERSMRWWSGTAWAAHHAARPAPAHSARPSSGAALPVPTIVPATTILSVPDLPPAPAIPPAPAAIVPDDLRARIPAQSLLEQLSRLCPPGRPGDAAAARTPLPPDARSWYVGAVGERRVAEILARLGPEWTVLHSVPVGGEGSDIDHVLIGPPGVYTINTKNHTGKTAWVASRAMMIGGQRVPYLRNSAFEARRAEKLLSAASGLTVEAAGLVVLVGTTTLTIRERPDGGDVVVGVVRDRDLLQTVAARRIYSDAQVARIVEAAVRPETRSSLPLPHDDTAALLARFESLDPGAPPATARTKAARPVGGKARPVGGKARPVGGKARSPRPARTAQRRRRPSGLAPLLRSGAVLIGIWIAYAVLYTR